MNTKHLMMTVAAVALIAGCKKETDSGGMPANVSNPVRDWCEVNLAAATQSFVVNASAGGTIYGADGVQISFVPGAFLTAGGAPVSGIVDVELVEVLGIADMILMNKQTLGDNSGTLQMLKSAGELKVTATQGGAELGIVADGATIKIPMTDPDPSMEGFYGAEDADGDVVWTSGGEGVTLPLDTFYFELTCDSMEWFNCDDFPPGATEPFTITVPPGHTVLNTQVWVAVPDLNGLVGCGFDGTGCPTYGGVPLGDAMIVGLAEIGGTWHSSFTPITVAAGITPSITFSPTTQAQFELDVQGL